LVSKIQEAIKQFLAFVKNPTATADIYETVAPYTTSKTPGASIRAALQKLWKAGQVKKYFIAKDGVRYDYPIEREVSSRLQREYQVIKEKFWRKEISIDIYCGVGKVRKEAKTIKMWTFENNTEDREEDLKDELLIYLQVNFDKCYYAGSDDYIGTPDNPTTKEIDAYAYDDSQEWKEENVPFVFPETDHD